MNSLLKIVLPWSGYCLLHSVLISLPVTNYIESKLPRLHRYYRLIYNIQSIVLLAFLVLYTRKFHDTPFFTWEGYLQIIQIVILLTGIMLLYSGSRNYSFSSFIGLSQIKSGNKNNLIKQEDEITIKGIHKYIRHPFYTAVIFIIWARNLDYTVLAVNLVLSIYVIIGTYLEERKLILILGNSYRNYRKSVSMFFPVKWILKKIINK